ncbi:hypothetical protein DL546_005872 [Coniochaeta pulveracea]|uniref:Ribosomal protein L34 n=1 Tax=Coniochaeta pulveracea TaxID=177199 RepID=A0A420Y6C2_9PEZI|nr:hypothetical protein DL546_005872 [Coniochaeta pulveracea]
MVQHLFSSLLGATTCLRAARSAAASKTLAGATRSFSSLPTLRPTLLTSSRPTIFRAPTTNNLSRFTPSTSEGITADLVPAGSISSHPALSGLGSQIRCGPRFLNMQRHTRLVQKRRHGFLSRVRTKNGRKMLARRKDKGRRRLSA